MHALQVLVAVFNFTSLCWGPALFLGPRPWTPLFWRSQSMTATYCYASVPGGSSGLGALLTAFQVSWGSGFCLQFPLPKCSASGSALFSVSWQKGLWTPAPVGSLLFPESSSVWPWSVFLPFCPQHCYFKLQLPSFPLPHSSHSLQPTCFLEIRRLQTKGESSLFQLQHINLHPSSF